MDQKNLDKAFQASELIVKYLQNSLEAEESRELDSWIEDSDQNRRLFSELTNPEELQKYLREFELTEAQKKAALRRVERRLFRGQSWRHRWTSPVWRYVAAAAITGIIVVAWLLLKNRSETAGRDTAWQQKTNYRNITVGDGNTAVLELNDGSLVILDSSKTGLLAREGGVNVLKQGDRIMYNAGTETLGRAAMHAVRTPKGKTYQVVLPDGSRVTLNALTTLEYPTAFKEGSRKISLEGEAYFEVTADNSKPFVVDVGKINIAVTGTKFNINAYKNEPVIKATLFEGGVKIIAQNAPPLDLKPGQQLVYDSAAKAYKLQNPDLEATAAWLNDLFNLDSTDVPTLMREIARWYDIDVIYDNGIPAGHFAGQISRNTDFNELLKVLDAVGIKTKLDGRKLIVLNHGKR